MQEIRVEFPQEYRVGTSTYPKFPLLQSHFPNWEKLMEIDRPLLFVRRKVLLPATQNWARTLMRFAPKPSIRLRLTVRSACHAHVQRLRRRVQASQLSILQPRWQGALGYCNTEFT